MSPEDAYEIFEAITEIENFSKPSKKEIVGQEIIDLGGGTEKDDTLYQRYGKLSKLVTQG